MPTTKLTYVKLFLELADDKRFIFELNDSQKLDYLLLLLMAGLTDNEIMSDVSYFKSRFNLKKELHELENNIFKITDVFKKCISDGNVIKFKNYDKLHNYIYRESKNSKRIPEVGVAEDKRTPIQVLIDGYILKKGYNKDNDPVVTKMLYKRNVRIAHDLCTFAKNDVNKLFEAMDFLSELWESKGLTWSLETLFKWYPEYLTKGKTSQYEKLLEIFQLKQK